MTIVACRQTASLYVARSFESIVYSIVPVCFVDDDFLSSNWKSSL
jgi:hypothetical protein